MIREKPLESKLQLYHSPHAFLIDTSTSSRNSPATNPPHHLLLSLSLPNSALLLHIIYSLALSPFPIRKSREFRPLIFFRRRYKETTSLSLYLSLPLSKEKSRPLGGPPKIFPSLSLSLALLRGVEKRK